MQTATISIDAARGRVAQASGRLLAAAVVGLAGLALWSATGIGATSATVTPSATVPLVLTLTEPTALDSGNNPGSPPTFTNGSPDVLSMGDITGAEVATAALTYRVSTNNPNGYELSVSNPNAAPLLQPTPNGLDDMDTSYRDVSHYTTTAPQSVFGVAAGDATGHNQASVNYAGTPWGTTGAGGTQGTLYRGVATGAGMLVARQLTPVVDDPVTLNFAAVITPSDPVTIASYSGTMRVTALTL